MATSPSRGSSRGTPRGPSSSSSSSSSRGGAPGGGGSTNTVATVVAVGLVGLIVGAVVLMSGGKKNKAPSLPAAVAPTAPVVPATPGKPAPPNFPAMPTSKLAEANALVQTFQADSAKANALYEESQKAKRSGDDAAWQSKLKEALGLAQGINQKWNDFIATLPHSNDYDVEEVARHYFERESGAVARMTATILRAQKTDEK